MNDIAEQIIRVIKRGLSGGGNVSIPRKRFRDAFDISGPEAIEQKAQELAEANKWKVEVTKDWIIFFIL